MADYTMDLQRRKLLAHVQVHAARQAWGFTPERAAAEAARKRQHAKLVRSVAFRKFAHGKWQRW